MMIKYLSYRKQWLLFSLLIMLLSVVFMALCSISFEMLVYFSLLAVFCFAIFLRHDYSRFSAKLKYLEEASLEIIGGNVNLTTDSDFVDEAYNELISSLNDCAAREKNAFETQRSEALEYYTMWIHQIKTPIAAMDLALNSRNTDKAVLKRELFTISQYVDMALSFARLKVIDNDIAGKACNLDAIVLDSIKKYATPFIYKNLSVNFTPTEMTVLSDEKWLFFIIGQLLDNAVKYTFSGGVNVYREDNALVVEDSGIGILEEDIPRIFEKGYTGYNGRFDKRASGLGLYMCRMTADKLSLKLSVASKLKEGTKIKIIFPEEFIIKKTDWENR